MRILVHEFVSGGGLAGQPVPPSLAREGRAMRDALVNDLAALRHHRIVTTVDPRFPLRSKAAEVVVLPPGNASLLDGLLASVDAAWLVAPETHGHLEALAARAERHGTALLGSSAVVIRRACDKQALPRLLARCGVSHPETHAVRTTAEAHAAGRAMGFPVVVKPARGAGCGGVWLVRSADEWPRAIASVRSVSAEADRFLVQRHVSGVAASVSLLAFGGEAVALAVNGQWLRETHRFSYRGGVTPLDSPRVTHALAAAVLACKAFPGFKGYVGVDLVLTANDAVVIEVNPRLTTAYLGLRAAMDENIARLALAACAGRLPKTPRARRWVRFSASGAILGVRRLARKGQDR
jgi:predicted ATP-grasp superfamily ATP-dependent carboligase